MSGPEKFLEMETAHPSLITDGVPRAEQVMPAHKAFWIFFTPSLCVSTWLLGVLAVQGLGFWPALLTIILGNGLAIIPSGIIARMGPRLRLTQIEGSKYALGRHGVKIPAFLNWLSSVGWDAINNVPAAGALVALVALSGGRAPYWIALLFLVVAQGAVAVYGHHVTQNLAKALGYILPAFFLILGLRAVTLHGYEALQTTGFTWKSFALSLGLIVTGATSWLAYISDYTRYLPAATNPRRLFWTIYLGIFLSIGTLEIFGLISSVALGEVSTDSIVALLEHLAGPFAPLVLVIVALSSIPANAINDNSAAYCLVTAGIRILRPLSAAIGAAIGFAMALYGTTHILSLFEDIMMLMLYWLLAWGGIVTVQALDPYATERTVKSWPVGATIFASVTLVSVFLFAANHLYEGPIAERLGGVDIGFYVAYLTAGFLYWLAIRKKPI